MPTGRKMAEALADRKAMRERDAEAKRRRIQKAAEDIVDGTVDSIREMVRQRKLPEKAVADAVRALRQQRAKVGA